MKTSKRTRTAVALSIIVVALLISIVPATTALAGGGNVVAGTPAKVNLKVCFQYQESDVDSWKPIFTEASKLLYNSTEGQMQLGTVTFYNCGIGKDEADILIENADTGARANVGGLGKSGTHIFISQRHKSTSGDRIGQFGIIHEFGHYGFNLYDEYQDQSGNQGPNINCVSATSTIASIMDGGTTVHPSHHRTEFCTKAGEGIVTSHNPNNEQESRHGESCWETIVSYCKSAYGLDLTMPDKNNPPSTSLPSGHQDVEFKIVDCAPRAMVCIDRSGSMTGDKIALAKLGGKIFVDLSHEGDELGVASYSTSPTLNFSLQEIVDTSTKTAAGSVIDAMSAGGNTNIGGGLRTSLNQIVSRGDPVANEMIVLLTDGLHNTGEHPSSVVPDLIARGVKVFTIGLGADADGALLSSIASQTGGEYYFAANAASLPGIFTSISTKVRNEDTIKTIADLIMAGGTVIKSVLIDVFSKEATFSLSWSGSDLDLTLVAPDGTLIDPVVAASDPNIEYLERTNNEFYRIQTPMPGEWQLVVHAVDVAVEEQFLAEVQAQTREVIFTGSTDKYQYVYPEEILIRAEVIAGRPVVGAQVEGTVSRPDGSTFDIVLFDDGNPSHGDQRAYDGIYSSLFSAFTEDGTYTFALSVDNTNGVEASPDVSERDPFFIPRTIPPFTRMTQASVVVSGIPSDIIPPVVTVEFPTANQAVQDGITLQVSASDASGVAAVSLYVREPDGPQGQIIGPGFEDLPATSNAATGKWEYNFDTLQLPDGYYLVLAKAVDTYNNEGWSAAVPFSIRNWAVIEMLPSTPNSNAGRTMPVKFALLVAASVDPTQPFVWNDDLTIKIYATSNPGVILQTPTFGTGARNYRIQNNTLYITNFQTSKVPMQYTVEIWRTGKNFLVGSFTFKTVK